MSMAAAISGDDAKVFHWSEDPRAITCITLEGVASAGPDERRRAKFLRRRRASSVPWRGTSMDGVYGASRAVLQSIAGIAGGCASWHPKIASSLGNCCSVGVTTAAGRVAGGVFIFAPSLGAPHATDQRHKLGARTSSCTSPAPSTNLRFLRRPVTACWRLARPLALAGTAGGLGLQLLARKTPTTPPSPALDLLPNAKRRLTRDISASAASRSWSLSPKSSVTARARPTNSTANVATKRKHTRKHY